MKYPRTVQLNDPKLTKYIQDKEELVLAGRKVAREIDLIVSEQDKLNKKLVKEENKVDIKDLKKKGDDILKLIESLAEDLNGVQKEIHKRIKDNTPQELRDQYDQLDKNKLDKETELSKLGHKVQKVKDRIIPIIHKLGKPHLEDEWEDFSTTTLGEDGIPILEIYNKLEDWKIAQRQLK